MGRFPAKRSPKTPLNGSGSKNGAERTSNQTWRQITMPFRDHFLFDHQNRNLKSSHKSDPNHCRLHGHCKRYGLLGVLARAPMAPEASVGLPGLRRVSTRTLSDPSLAATLCWELGFRTLLFGTIPPPSTPTEGGPPLSACRPNLHNLGVKLDWDHTLPLLHLGF